MKINVTIQGAIDVPDEWEDPENGTTAVDVADYRYNEQLTENEAIRGRLPLQRTAHRK